MTQEWLTERRKGIGGSDAPVVCGLSPWKTPYQLYLEKRGEADGEIPDNESMMWGRNLEPVIRQHYSTVTGRTVEIPKGILVHPAHPRMIGSLDGISHPTAADEDNWSRVLEVKTARMPIGWGEPGSEEIPEHYLAQVQHYMAVTGLPMADVAVLIGGSDFRLYEIQADPELQGLLIEREAEFWGMVESGTPPEVTTFADVRARFGAKSEARQVQANPDCLVAIANLRGLQELDRQADEWKAIVMKHLGDADTLVDGDTVLATWKVAKPSKRFDAKAFEAEYPDLYSKFKKEGQPSRRFLLK